MSAASDKREANMALRKNVRQQLGDATTEQIEYIATLVLEKFPDEETARRLTIATSPVSAETPRFPLPADLSEATLWPLIEKRQAHVALNGGPKESLDAAMFFAKMFGKVKGESARGSSKPPPPPEKSDEERLLEMADTVHAHVDHEPGAATTVDSGIGKR